MIEGKFISHAEFGQMTELLMDDVERCWNELRKAETKEDQNFWKRAFTRAVFAKIEGFTEFFRSQALASEFNKMGLSISAGTDLKFDPGLISILGGDAYSINEDGEIKIQTLRTPFLQNLLFCFKRFAEAYNVQAQIKKGDQWSKIQSAVRVRDGLMHPKTLKSLEIGEQEIEDVVFTLRWFYQQLHTIMKQNFPDEEFFEEFPDEIFKLKLKKL
jgi:hypothetical protein